MASPKEVDSERPIEDLISQVLEMAVLDIQELTMEGYIRNGKCVYTMQTWPTMKNGIRRRILGFYDKPHLVKELIAFFIENHHQALLEIIGSDVAPIDITGAVFNQELVKRVVLERVEKYEKRTGYRGKKSQRYKKVKI